MQCPHLTWLTVHHSYAYADYTGYGKSDGSPHENHVYADIEAAYTYMRTVLNIPWENIILFGRSIGTGPTCHLATIAPVRAVILQAPLASVFRILFSQLRFSLPGDLFRNIDRIPKIDCPVFSNKQISKCLKVPKLYISSWQQSVVKEVGMAGLRLELWSGWRYLIPLVMYVQN